MSFDLEQRLREAFGADAQQARLVNPDGPPALEPRPWVEDPARPRHPRWLVAAAVAAVLALITTLMLTDDDQDVDTIPPVTLPSPVVRVEPGVGQIISGSGCPFGIGGPPVDVQPGSIAGRFATAGGQGVAHVLMGSLVAEIHVPGVERTGTTWREEGIDLERGSATVWLDGPPSASRPGAGELPFVQARFFTGSDAPCSSFTVTVDGGSEEANRRAAVDLAGRILLPAELQDLDLPGTEGGPVAGLGDLAGTEWAILVETNEARMSFTEDTVTWDNRCATKTADYKLDREEGILTVTNRVHVEGICNTRSINHIESLWPVIDDVMLADQISVALIEGRLHLTNERTAGAFVLGAPGPSTEDRPALPPPGPQPADLEDAEAEVRAAFVGLFDATVPREDRARFVDRPEVWLPFNQALFESEYGEILRDLHAVVDAVVFTSPTHASVRFQLLASDDRVPTTYIIGDALLVDGRWVVAVTTPCMTAEATGHTCDLSP